MCTGGSSAAALEEGKEVFFFEKKNQKTFALSGTGAGLVHTPRVESFLVLFFKSEHLPYA
jgi:hypothetical protein